MTNPEVPVYHKDPRQMSQAGAPRFDHRSRGRADHPLVVNRENTWFAVVQEGERTACIQEILVS